MSEETLTESMRNTLERRRQRSGLRSLTIAGDNSTDFSSNDFLSLRSSSLLRAAYMERLRGDFDLGSGGSRLLDGNSKFAEQLETDITAFHRAPAGLLFNSGFDANSGLYASVPQSGDIVIYDEYIHASVHEGMRLSRAATRVSFSHNSVASLRSTLESMKRGNSSIASGKSNVFVGLESVYSMDGDVAPLVDIVRCVDELLPNKNGYVIVDEAHATGVIGARGAGLVCELGLENRVFARVHTFGKALSCNGAIVLCSEITKQYLINYARPLIYSTFMSYPALAAIRSSYELLWTGLAENRRSRLWKLVQHFDSRLEQLDVLTDVHGAALLQMPPRPGKSSIFSVLTPYPRELARYCQDAGFVVRAIVPPTVPKGAERVRVCLHADNSTSEIDLLVQCIGRWMDDVKAGGTTPAARKQSRL
ncbi:PLP-dependent transferase [Lipomyces doorenjongii]|uniref:PLP-dependent transferase n=1 Tax=Lipomyces doorenjongii TaxID=383834 RepID=UPI0034CFA18C